MREHVLIIDFQNSIIEVRQNATYRYEGQGVVVPVDFYHGLSAGARRFDAA